MPRRAEHSRVTHSKLKNERGFSLVEIMVGMLIGLLGMIVIMQVSSLFEGQKRTTTGGDDAQNAGAIALYGLQRDIRRAGYGINAYKLIGCDVQLRAGPPAVTLTAMAPVTINHPSIPAGDANTDTLLVAYGSSNGTTEGDGITTQPANNAPGTSVFPDIYAVQTPGNFSINDWVVAEAQVRPAPVCSLIMTRVASVGVGANNNVAVTPATGAAGMANGTLYNLGQSPSIQAYAVRSGNLTVCDYMVNDCGNAGNVANTAIWVPVASGIVSLRAIYGHDTATTAIVYTTPPNPMPSYAVNTADSVTPTTACGWMRTLGIGVAVVARSSQINSSIVTTAAPTLLGDASDPIDLSADADWQRYRYKVFQTIIPMKNMVLQGVQSGC